MGFFKALFTPPIPPITDTGAVIEWFIQHDERIADVKDTVPEPHLTSLKDTIQSNTDDCETATHLQQHLDEAAEINGACLETMYAYRIQTGSVAPDDAAKAIVLEASASAMLRIYGYFMLKRYGVDPAEMDGVLLRGSLESKARDRRLGEVVYLDTSGWNGVLDAGGATAIERHGRLFLFSSCNMDEFALAPADKAKALIQLAYSLSNRQKLLDHVEMTAVEIATSQAGGSEYPVFDDEDLSFYEAWDHARIHGLPEEVADQMQLAMRAAKAKYRDHLRRTRDLFKPLFQRAAHIGVMDDWQSVIADFNSEGHITLMLEEMLKADGYLESLPAPDALANVPWRQLPCTSCWVEYHLALSYLASREGGRIAKPDLGDQVDFRHACYAGLSDVFVTGDKRMAEVLGTMVVDRRARVVQVEQFIEE